MGGSSSDDPVGVAGVNVHRNAALMVVHAGCVDNPLEHGALGVSNPPIEYLEVSCLGVPTVSEDPADGSQVFGAAVRAGQHHDRPDTGKLPALTSLSIQARKRCANQAALAMCDDGDVISLR